MNQSPNNAEAPIELSDILSESELAQRARKAGFTIEYLERQIQAIEGSRFGEYARLARDTLLPVAATVGVVGLTLYLYQVAKAHPESANWETFAIASLAFMLINSFPNYITEIRKRFDELKRIPQPTQFYRDMLNSLRQYPRNQPELF